MKARTMLAHAQELVYILKELMPTQYQKDNLEAMLGLFLEAQGHPLPIIPVTLGGLAAAAGGSFGFGLLDVDGIHAQIKQKVFDLGFEKFQESLEEIFEKINERISSAFNEKVELSRVC